jgi:hypothetical protein
MNKRDELKKAVETARRTYDRLDGPTDGKAVILGALIRAVEILATNHLDDAIGSVETAEIKAQSFPDELVERLARVYWDSRADEFGASKWDALPTHQHGIKEGSRKSIQAILTELARTEIADLPKGLILSTGDATGAAHVVLAVVRPILAAKDAEIERLQQTICFQNKFAEDYVSRGVYEAHVADLQKRINELEAMARPANEVSNSERSQYEITITQQKRQIAREINIRRYQEELANEQIDRADAAEARCAELEKRLAEATKAPIVDKMTSEQLDEFAKKLVSVFDEAYHGGPNDHQASTRAGIRAVLVAFHASERARAAFAAMDGEYGVVAKLERTSKMQHEQIADLDAQNHKFGSAALQRVWDKIEQFRVESQAARKTTTAQFAASEALETALRIIDAEIAECGVGLRSLSALNQLRERFMHTPSPGDGDDGKWILRADVLNAIDEIAALA